MIINGQSGAMGRQKRGGLEDYPRIGDLSYWTSPPMQFTYIQSAALTAGTYPFTASRGAMINAKNINAETLIYFYDMQFSADIGLLDYQQALKLAGGTTDVPRFSLFLESSRNAPVLQDPIYCQDYFDGQSYQLVIEPKQLPNAITAFFQGTLQQHAGLAGVTEINLIMTMFAQQITDDSYISEFKKGYPSSDYQGGNL